MRYVWLLLVLAVTIQLTSARGLAKEGNKQLEGELPQPRDPQEGTKEDNVDEDDEAEPIHDDNLVGEDEDEDEDDEDDEGFEDDNDAEVIHDDQNVGEDEDDQTDEQNEDDEDEEDDDEETYDDPDMQPRHHRPDHTTPQVMDRQADDAHPVPDIMAREAKGKKPHPADKPASSESEESEEAVPVGIFF